MYDAQLVSFAKPSKREIEKIRNTYSKGTLIGKNLYVLGRRTSVKFEREMWESFVEVSKIEGCSVHDIASLIFIRKKPGTSLSAAIRVFLVLYFKAAATNQGHILAGHGNFEEMQRRAGLPSDQKAQS